jgi:hypothetical protein
MNSLSICSAILELDNAIRFAGIASQVSGKILAAKYREGVTPHLTIKESELSIMQSLIRMSTRKALEQKLGNTIYSATVYEKVKRASIVISSGGSNGDAILIVSFEKEADHDAIITKKILPFLNDKVGKDFL